MAVFHSRVYSVDGGDFDHGNSGSFHSANAGTFSPGNNGRLHLVSDGKFDPCNDDSFHSVNNYCGNLDPGSFQPSDDGKFDPGNNGSFHPSRSNDEILTQVSNYGSFPLSQTSAVSSQLRGIGTPLLREAMS